MPRELGDRRCREVHRQHREPDEAVRVAEVRRRGGVVVALGELLRERLVRPVDHRQRERQRVHRDALLVHRFQARIEIGEPRSQRVGCDRAGLEDDAPAVDVGDLAAAARALLAPQRDQLLGVEVRVDVDRRLAYRRGTLAGRGTPRTGEYVTAAAGRVAARWRVPRYPVFLSRVQFAFLIGFHIILPAFTIGLAAWLATIDGARLVTGNPLHRATRSRWRSCCSTSASRSGSSSSSRSRCCSSTASLRTPRSN